MIRSHPVIAALVVVALVALVFAQLRGGEENAPGWNPTTNIPCCGIHDPERFNR